MWSQAFSGEMVRECSDPFELDESKHLAYQISTLFEFHS